MPMAGSAEQRVCRIQCLESIEEESCRSHGAKAAPARADQTEMSKDLNDPSQPPQQPESSVTTTGTTKATQPHTGGSQLGERSTALK